MKISTVHFSNPQAKYTILYSHVNAENLDGILWLLREIRDSGFAVFAYDYQGYGTSQGKPSEYNTYRDIEAAYNGSQESEVCPMPTEAYALCTSGSSCY